MYTEHSMNNRIRCAAVMPSENTNMDKMLDTNTIRMIEVRISFMVDRVEELENMINYLGWNFSLC